ncbi:hypothetical protein DAEQUDRAFT_414712 [Daedalea quercina L-15889]|uniref:Uncharacterized protein n=1 Tax=Daedalea quercina L-15889 TaxID=1314783 RepID=A0A165THY5_9APHY|nr:hypothetical protein DAEQUDRAFT_414712 [Daedalea quercina L-15889]
MPPFHSDVLSRIGPSRGESGRRVTTVTLSPGSTSIRQANDLTVGHQPTPAPDHDLSSQVYPDGNEGNGPSNLEPCSASTNGPTDHQSADGLDEVIDGAAKKLRNHKAQPTGKTTAGKVNSISLSDAEDTASALVSPLEFDTVQNDVNGFFEGVPALMGALSEVAKMHPFISIVVLAFESVYKLEKKRRENDSNVIALYVEMRDMMTVLLQLKNIKDPSAIDIEGITIEGRMQGLIKQTAKDIKECANLCDVWSRKKLPVRFFKGPFWAGKFVNYVNQFAQRRKDLEFAMSMHAVRGIDHINSKLDELNFSIVEDRAKPIIYFIQANMLQDQQQLQTENREELSAVLGDESAEAHNMEDTPELHRGYQDPEEAVAGNLSSFERQLDILQREIVDDTEAIVTRESDRVIQSVIAGPHDRIRDKDLYNMWKDMGWRGSVKTRHFVLALRDYYHDRAEEQITEKTAFEAAHVLDSDAWCLEFVNMKRLQSISEAFDDDASGFITVSEANHFTSSRPAGWSLLRWIAYWAVGWQNTATVYKEKIWQLMERMFALKPWIHHENRQMVDRYLDSIWLQVMSILMPLRSLELHEKTRRQFKAYVDEEEQRLERNLDIIRYRVDDLTTLAIVTGPGRIEKYLLPLLYLMLRRDLQILITCQHSIVNERELWDCTDSIQTVMTACKDRRQVLNETFLRGNLRPEEQFKIRHCGLFELIGDTSETRKRLFNAKFAPVKYDESPSTGDEELSTTAHLNHPLKPPYCPEVEQYHPKQFIEANADHTALSPVKDILGTWYGFLGEKSLQTWPHGPMFTLDIHATDRGSHNFEAAGFMPDSMKGIAFTLRGDVEATSQGDVTYVLYLRFSVQAIVMELRGRMSENRVVISGEWGSQGMDVSRPDIGPFVLTRMPPEVLSFRPTPWELGTSNRTRALWRFALSAVEHQALKSAYRWEFFRRRRDARRRYVEFCIRDKFGRPLCAEEKTEWRALQRSLSPADARFYASMAEYQILRTNAVHIGYACDSCHGHIMGSRMVCMTCVPRSLDTVDLCSDPRCLASTIDQDQYAELNSPHLPSHDIFQLRTTMHERERRQYNARAREALDNAQTILNNSWALPVGDSDSPKGNGMTSTGRMAHGIPRCQGCGAAVQRPCWYCVECYGA